MNIVDNDSFFGCIPYCLLRYDRERITFKYFISVERKPCKKCGSKNTVGYGRRKNRYVIVQKHKCMDCFHIFSLYPEKFRMEIKQYVINLYENGEDSFRKIAKVLNNQGIEISHGSIHNWVRKGIENKSREIPMEGQEARVNPQWGLEYSYS